MASSRFTGRSSGSPRLHHLIAGRAENQSASPDVGIDDDMGGRRAELLAGVEDPGIADAIDP